MPRPARLLSRSANNAKKQPTKMYSAAVKDITEAVKLLDGPHLPVEVDRFAYDEVARQWLPFDYGQRTYPRIAVQQLTGRISPGSTLNNHELLLVYGETTEDPRSVPEIQERGFVTLYRILCMLTEGRKAGDVKVRAYTQVGDAVWFYHSGTGEDLESGAQVLVTLARNISREYQPGNLL